MDLRLYDIDPALQPFIKVICTMDNHVAIETLRPFRVLPDTCTELFINYIDCGPTIISSKSVGSNYTSFVVSRMNNYMDVKTPVRSGCITVCFLPGKARHFFSLPMTTISNEVVGLGELCKAAIGWLEEKIREIGDANSRVSIVQRFLLKQLEKNYRPDKTVEYCLCQLNKYKGQLSIAGLAAKVGISNRQFVLDFFYFFFNIAFYQYRIFLYSIKTV